MYLPLELPGLEILSHFVFASQEAWRGINPPEVPTDILVSREII
jgi:hypothetical protein